METERNGWSKWNGKEVFVRLKTNKVYSGKIIQVDESSKPIIFITILDKFGNNVLFLSTEILELKEEKNGY